MTKISKLYGKFLIWLFGIKPSILYSNFQKEIKMKNITAFTVKELHKVLTRLIEEGNGDKTVELSVNYDSCNHIQKLGKIHNYSDDINWITLEGLRE